MVGFFGLGEGLEDAEAVSIGVGEVDIEGLARAETIGETETEGEGLGVRLVFGFGLGLRLELGVNVGLPEAEASELKKIFLSLAETLAAQTLLPGPTERIEIKTKIHNFLSISLFLKLSQKAMNQR